MPGDHGDDSSDGIDRGLYLVTHLHSFQREIVIERRRDRTVVDSRDSGVALQSFVRRR
jgi:hypothetical protein